MGWRGVQISYELIEMEDGWKLVWVQMTDQGLD